MNNTHVSLEFLGAAGTVTGSKHFLKTPEVNIMVDCGLFQGIKALRLKNREALPVPVNEIDVVILTHAHLDHCGYIPLLVKSGFKGKILMTPPTRDLAEIILRDSAKIQEEDAERANREGFSRHHPALPLYTEKDAEDAFNFFETHDDEVWIPLSENVRFLFRKNGHILGSCYVIAECFGKTIVFSGDIGKQRSEMLPPPSPVTKADFLIMESTYGDRLHPVKPAADEVAEAVLDTIKKGGNLLIPSFAVGRAQELMLIINELKKQIRIPDLPVYMDSPMGADATEILCRYPQWHRLSPEQCRGICENIHIIRDFHETKKIVLQKGSKIVIAASGMLTGGRVLEYMKHYSESHRNTLLLVGYQVEGTRGRALLQHTDELKIHGKFYKIKCEVRHSNSLSAHADRDELIQWLHGFEEQPTAIFLVHGEPQVQDAFRVKIRHEMHTTVIIPKQHDAVPLFNV